MSEGKGSRRLSNVGSSGEVKTGCGVCREGKRFGVVVIVVVVIVAAAGAKLEGRRGRLTIYGGVRPKLEHFLGLGFISGGGGG